MPSISQAEFKKLVEDRPPGTQPGEVAQALINRGYKLEGVSMAEPGTRENFTERRKKGLIGSAIRGVGDIAKDIGRSALKPTGEFIASGAELLQKAGLREKGAPEFTEKIRLAGPELRAVGEFEGGLKGEEAQQFIQEKKGEGAEGAGFVDVLNIASFIPGGAALKGVAGAKGAATAAKIGKAGATAKGVGTGAGFGSAFAVADKLDQGVLDVEELIKAGAFGTLVGGVTGGALGAGTTALPKAISGAKKKLAGVFETKVTNLGQKAETTVRDGVLKMTANELRKESKKKVNTPKFLLENKLLAGTREETLQGVKVFLDSTEDDLQRALAGSKVTNSFDEIESAVFKRLDAEDLALKPASRKKVLREVTDIIEELRGAAAKRGGNFTQPELNIIKRDIWKNAFGQQDVVLKDGLFTVGETIMEMIEKNVKSANAINRVEKSAIMAIRQLEKSQGRKISGKWSARTAQILGAILGLKLGPAGAAAGSEAARRLEKGVNNPTMQIRIAKLVRQLAEKGTETAKGITAPLTEAASAISKEIPKEVKDLAGDVAQRQIVKEAVTE